jgi:agmatine deiminase
MSDIHPKPSALGYRMPAEWEPHEATWLIWPHDERHWPGKFDRIPKIWAKMARELSAGEDVHILVHDDAVEAEITRELEAQKADRSRIFLHRAPSNFSWTRDEGPIFVKSHAGEVALTHWKHNGWGEQWEHDRDDHVPEEVERITGLRRFPIPMVLEGGSIDVNGQGCLLTTENCLLNPNRNPGMTKEQIELALKDNLGVTRVLWLGEGIAGDDTSGHVDDLTRFIGPRTVLTVVQEDPKDVNHRPLQENLERLQRMTDQDGRTLEVVTVPLPPPIFYEGTRLPASYANFYVGNAAVLLPVFNQPTDIWAVEVLTEAFPDRKIVPIDCNDLIWGFGAFHCVTQQQPKAGV